MRLVIQRIHKIGGLKLDKKPFNDGYHKEKVAAL